MAQNHLHNVHNLTLRNATPFDPEDSRSILMNKVRERIFTSGEKYSDIAKRAGISPSTVGNMARGNTRWPRTTLNVLYALGYTLDVKRLRK